MGIPASAAANDGAAVDVSVDAEAARTIPVTVNGELNNVTVPTEKMCAQEANSENKNVITAADVLLAYAGTKEQVAAKIASGDIKIGWGQITGTDKVGLYITKFDGEEGTNNYELLNPDTCEDDGYYEYKWTGSYWSLYINNQYASYYASHYPASEVTGIRFDFIEDNVGYTFRSETKIN